jgi:hypothetical protein
MSTNTNENQQGSMTMNKMSKYQTKQLSINEYLTQILGVGQVAFPSDFVLCENYLKTHYKAPENFQPSVGNAGTTN